VTYFKQPQAEFEAFSLKELSIGLLNVSEDLNQFPLEEESKTLNLHCLQHRVHIGQKHVPKLKYCDSK
jgi:hypothetical protein